MLKELIKQQENKSLNIYVKKVAEYGQRPEISPEKSADIISERMNNALKKKLSEQGFEVIATQ